MTRRQFAQLLAGIGGYIALTRPPLLRAQERPMRVGVSAETLAGANINDARAAYKVWGQEIQRRLGITHTDLVPDVFIPSEQLIKMIREGTIDCFALTAWEYAQVIDLLDTNWVLLDDYAAAGLEYILAVHSASPYKKIEDLHGGQLIIHHHRDTLLLTAWLSLLLSANGLPPPERFFGSMLSKDNLTQVVVPVFFRRSEAAGLTQRAFSVAEELNPQLGRDLRVLAVSPKLIPMAFCFRRGCKPEDVKEFRDALVKLRTIPVGQQLLELYQVKGYTAEQGSVMKPTLDLVRQYEYLRSHPAPAARKGRS